jgi:hypothetical protein
LNGQKPFPDEDTMEATTERIPVLVTPEEKRRISDLANDAGLSVSEFLRQAAAAFRPTPGDEILTGMIDQVISTTSKASAAIDEALAFVEASNLRMAALEAS